MMSKLKQLNLNWWNVYLSGR